MIRPTVRLGALLVVAALLTSAYSCNPTTVDPAPLASLSCQGQAGKPLTLVVGARANSPRPDMPPAVVALIQEAALAHQEIHVILLDGVPSVQLNATFNTNGKNSSIRNQDLNNFVSGISGFVQKLTPQHPQADVLAGLTQAGNLTNNGVIVLFDSGLPTTGPLSFTDADMFDAQPGDIVAYLQAQHLTPQLPGDTVDLVGVGDTADPQPVLDQNHRSKLVDLWTAVAKGGGAGCVDDLKTGLSRTSVKTTVPVAVVSPPVPQPPFDCGTTVLSDGGNVGFVVGTATLRDEAAAKPLLQRLADKLRSTPNARATLIGTTSSEGSTEANQTLSEQRAQAIRALLIQLGVDQSRITASGEGENGPHHINDVAPDGSLIPAAAAHNRSVIVQLSC
ncbi:MAG TPA: OmpA family protein [Pseudonocardiaceae bacterium]|nr:OmpA family protein [Pseudonocardiaceae bacterium]